LPLTGWSAALAAILGAGAIWAVIQALSGISVDPHRTLEAALEWTVRAVAFAIGVSIGVTLARQPFLTAQLLFGTLVSVASIVALFLEAVPAGAALGPFAYKNQFAAFVEPLLGIALASAILDQRRWALWTAGTALLFACVVAAGSRAGVILCAAELVFIPIVAFGRRLIGGRSLVRVAALGLAASALSVAMVGWTAIWTRFQEPNPYALRADLLRSSVAMIRERPLTGFGLGAWSSAYPAYARFDDGSFVNQAHSDWAQWAAEGGLPFFALLAIFVVMLGRPALRSLWGLGLLAVFAHAVLDYPFQQRPALAAYFFALAGIAFARREQPAISSREQSFHA
jgi:O-antigen ligase